MSAAPRLARAVVGAPADHAPARIRIVHLGLGAFARAHQAAYTAEVDDAGEWGIAAFTGRSSDIADELGPQDGLFTLVERSAAGDRAQIVTSVVEVNAGSDLARLRELIAAEQTAIVTLTITEAGYRLTGAGEPDVADPLVVSDLAALSSESQPARLDTALARLVWALGERQRGGGGPVAVVSCDNMPDNGEYLRRGLLALAAHVDASLAEWISRNVSFVATSVDRITPRTTEADRQLVVQLTGFVDASPVVTEPFRDWVLCGSFPAGRPAWERAGARFVDDIEPYERRKLWLLNGAHSLLAYAGLLRGHATVAEAIEDEALLAAVRALWDEAARHLPSELDAQRYCDALLERFENARIAHHLAQISAEGLTKVRVRIVPVALQERAAGRSAAGAATALAAWITLVLRGDELVDAQREVVLAAARAEEPITALVQLADPSLAGDAEFVAAVQDAVSRLRQDAVTPRTSS